MIDAIAEAIIWAVSALIAGYIIISLSGYQDWDFCYGMAVGSAVVCLHKRKKAEGE